MLINEVCKKCSLTKKAIEYYETQGLIAPAVLENGYRDFSERDAARLSEISVLRRLGLSVSDIRAVIDHNSYSVLYDISARRRMELEEMQVKQKLVMQLAAEQNLEKIRVQLEQLERKQSILKRLLDKFPGYYGKYASFHFAQFLDEPIETSEQERAFDTVIEFLDNVEIAIPKELHSFFEEITLVFSDEHFQQLNTNMASVIEDTEKFIADNKENIEKYLAFRETDEYKSSPAFKVQELINELNRQNGYYDIFLPAMRILSTSYRKYYEKLLKADKEFMRSFPQK